MKIAIDVKNLALFKGGIAAYIRPLIKALIESEKHITFVLIGPKIDTEWISHLNNYEIKEIAWPKFLPRQLRHPVYDIIFFPKAIREVMPNFIFTPYHDVLLPKHIPSIMMIHDTCIAELKQVYPPTIRLYYDVMLKINLKRCEGVFTVSKASKASIKTRYDLEGKIVTVIPNTFLTKVVNEDVKSKNLKSKDIILFYPGGAEFRKNVKRLILSLEFLQECGYTVSLRVTGDYDRVWQRQISQLDGSLTSMIVFLGYLEQNEVEKEYRNADVVVYPTLCEGFGRVCLEAMGVGAKLACSDIPVLNEVAEDYAVYFNPFNPADIAKKIIVAYHQEDKKPFIKKEYLEANISKLFIAEVKKYISRK